MNTLDLKEKARIGVKRLNLAGRGYI